MSKETAKIWRKNNKEKVREYNRKSREKHREKVVERNRRWRKENPEKDRECHRRWRKANPEKVKTAHDRWVRDNIDRVHATRKAWYARNKDSGHMPQQRKACSAVTCAIRKGKLIRPSVCSICGKYGKPEAHHYKGYNEKHWLDVEWLCKKCHYKARN